MIIADILLVLITFVALLIASYLDVKNKEVPDWISFGLIAAALGIRALYAFNFNDWLYLLYGLAGFGLMFILGIILFYAKMWGGADSKLLMAFGAVFATKPSFIKMELSFFGEHLFFLLIILISIAIVGAIYGLGWGIYIYFKNMAKANKEIKRLFIKKKFMRKIYFILAVSFIFVALIFSSRMLKPITLALAIIFFVYPYFYFIIKGIENVGMVKLISTKKLREGDWIIENVKIGKKIICQSSDLGLSKIQLKELRKLNRQVLIKEGIAFVPAIFLGSFLVIILGILLQ
ncbi:MAG: A24 family peptidase [Nanoarchaeota archaeon]|nr:A24 family peptidase [Nanoarchaeota archaeon]